jgi:hypothetical protein
MATVATATRSTTLTLASASAGPFNVGYRLFDDDTLDVFVNGTRSTAFTLSTTYADGYDDAASITFDAALAIDDVVVIESNLTPGRDDDYVSGDPSLVSKMNIELGRVWSKLSDLHRGVSRSLRGFDAIDPVDGVSLDTIAEAGANATAAAASAAEAEAARVLAVAAQENLFDAWTGSWLTATDYAVGDLARDSGTTYICLVAHTSGTFATDLAASKWEAFAQKGDAGAGAGDVLAANNGSEFNAATLRTNIGLGGLATLDILDEDDMATDSATRPPSQQSTKAYVDGLMTAYESAETTIALNTLYTFTHGLGAMPDHVYVAYVCKSAINGYLVGDEVPIAQGTWNWNSNGAPAIGVSSTYVKVRIADAGLMFSIGLDGSVRSTYLPANFNLIVRAWKYR